MSHRHHDDNQFKTPKENKNKCIECGEPLTKKEKETGRDTCFQCYFEKEGDE